MPKSPGNSVLCIRKNAFFDFFKKYFSHFLPVCYPYFQCSDTVGWVTGRASGL